MSIIPNVWIRGAGKQKPADGRREVVKVTVAIVNGG